MLDLSRDSNVQYLNQQRSSFRLSLMSLCVSGEAGHHELVCEVVGSSPDVSYIHARARSLDERFVGQSLHKAEGRGVVGEFVDGFTYCPVSTAGSI